MPQHSLLTNRVADRSTHQQTPRMDAMLTSNAVRQNAPTGETGGVAHSVPQIETRSDVQAKGSFWGQSYLENHNSTVLFDAIAGAGAPSVGRAIVSEPVPIMEVSASHRGACCLAVHNFTCCLFPCLFPPRWPSRYHMTSLLTAT